MKIYRLYILGMRFFQVYVEELIRAGWKRKERFVNLPYITMPKWLERYEEWRSTNKGMKIILGDVGMALAGIFTIGLLLLSVGYLVILLFVYVFLKSLAGSMGAHLAADEAADAGDYGASAAYRDLAYDLHEEEKQGYAPHEEEAILSALIPIYAIWRTVKRGAKSLF